jgi:hypothetical protein
VNKLFLILLMIAVNCFAAIPTKDFSTTGYTYGGNTQSKPESTVIVPPPSGGSATKEPSSVLTFTDQTTAYINALPNGVLSVYSAYDADTFDANFDGCTDLYIGSHDDSIDPGSLYLGERISNNCTGKFIYKNRPTQSGDTGRITNNIYVLDLNNDYLPDLTGLDSDGSPSAVYLNSSSLQGTNMVFTEPASGAGCKYYFDRCSFADFNGDGSIDSLAVSSSVSSSPNRVYDITTWSTGTVIFESGLSHVDTGDGSDLPTPIVSDFNNDSRPDFFDPVRQFIYINNTPSSVSNTDLFTKLTSVSPNDTSITAITATADAVGARHHGGNERYTLDYDSDGDMDVVGIRVRKFYAARDLPNTTADDEGRVYLLRNNGDNSFTDVTSLSGIGNSGYIFNNGMTTYGNLTVDDIDNNGDPDILISSCNSWTPPAAQASSSTGSICVLKNYNGVFTSQSISLAGITGGTTALGSPKTRVQTDDLNYDGKLEIIQAGTSLPSATHDSFRIATNQTSNSNRWMKVKLIGASPQHTEGLGTRLTWYESDTNKVITSREMFTSGWAGRTNYQHAGLGGYDIADLEVKWANGGAVYRYKQLPSNRTYIIYSDGTLIPYTQGVAISTTPPAEEETTLIVTPQSGITGTNELVTTGVVFAQGEVISPTLVRVYNESGIQVPAFVKSTLKWHWKDNSVRAVKVQFNFNASSGAKNYKIKWNKARSSTIAEQTVVSGLRNSTAIANKDGSLEPRVLATLTPAYITESGIVAPFDIADSSYHDVNWMTTFWSTRGESYPYVTTSTPVGADWLFDRTSTIYALAMRHNDQSMWREAFRSGRTYIKYIIRTGSIDTTDNKGAWSLGAGGDDEKYIYPKAIKLYLAFTGDDEYVTGTTSVNDLVNSMAQRWTLGNYQPRYGWLLPYDSVSRAFTERAAGLGIESQVNAWEITGDTAIKTRIDTSITNLHAMMNNTNPDGSAGDGMPRHSWIYHEGNTAYTSTANTGVSYDRAFSPWMIANIQDALWDLYWTDSVSPSDKTKLETMMRDIARANLNYGYRDSAGYVSTNWPSGFFVTNRSTANTSHDCNDTDYTNFTTRRNGAIPVYGAWPIFDFNTVAGWTEFSALTANFASDRIKKDTEHQGDMLGVLAKGLFFESNPTNVTAMKTKIELHNNAAFRYCASAMTTVDNPIRSLNWNFRSNGWGTWKWVKNELGIP